jgi:hypothetical protein
MRTLFGEWTPLDAARLANANSTAPSHVVPVGPEFFSAGIGGPDHRTSSVGLPAGFWRDHNKVYVSTSRGSREVTDVAIQAGRLADKLSQNPGAAVDVNNLRETISQLRADHVLIQLMAQIRQRNPGV